MYNLFSCRWLSIFLAEFGDIHCWQAWSFGQKTSSENVFFTDYGNDRRKAVLIRFIQVIGFAGLVGLLVYLGATIWPLSLDEATGIIAAISCALGFGLVIAVFLDSRSSAADKGRE